MLRITGTRGLTAWSSRTDDAEASIPANVVHTAKERSTWINVADAVIHFSRSSWPNIIKGHEASQVVRRAISRSIAMTN